MFHCKGPVRLGGRPHSFDDVVSLGVKATVTMQDLYLSVQGQGQVADQLASRRKDHGQVSIIMNVLFDAI